MKPLPILLVVETRSDLQLLSHLTLVKNPEVLLLGEKSEEESVEDVLVREMKRRLQDRLNLKEKRRQDRFAPRKGWKGPGTDKYRR